MRGTMVCACLCAVLAAACSPRSDELTCAANGEPCPGEARWLFEHDVRPLVETNCADCHSNPHDALGAPDFLDVVPGDFYASLVSRADFVRCDVGDSLILTKGLDPDHPGGALTEPQRERVEGWLRKEAEERFGGVCKDPPVVAGSGGAGSGNPGTGAGAGNPSGDLDGLAAIAQFGDCMTLDDWNETNMPLVAKQHADDGQGSVQCYTCHSGGTGDNWMVDPASDAAVADAFEKMRRPYSIYKLVWWTVHDEDGSFKDIVQSHRWRDKGSDPEHASYALAPEYQEYIDEWFTRTYDRWKSGACAK